MTALHDVVNEDRIVFFSNDEIVYDMTDASDLYTSFIFRDDVEDLLDSHVNVPFKVELFSLYKIKGTDGYCKKVYRDDGEYDIKLKCLDDQMIPFVISYLLGEEITESDKVFYHKGMLAKFIEVPEVRINLKELSSLERMLYGV